MKNKLLITLGLISMAWPGELDKPRWQNSHFLGAGLGFHLPPSFEYQYWGQSYGMSLGWMHDYNSAWSAEDKESASAVREPRSWSFGTFLMLKKAFGNQALAHSDLMGYHYGSLSLVPKFQESYTNLRVEGSLGSGIEWAMDALRFNVSAGFRVGRLASGKAPWYSLPVDEIYFAPTMDFSLGYGFRMGPSQMGAKP